MRQVGTLPDERQARTFADYLVAQDITAHAERDGDGWAIWVRDEEHLQQAAAEFKDYRANPEDRRYAGALAQAEEKRRAEVERRRAAAKNVIEMRGNWNAGLTRRAPLTFLLIAGTILVFFMTGMDINPNNATTQNLMFESPTTQRMLGTPQPMDPSVFRDILRGQVWRLVTPMLLHGGAMHIFFNMYMLYYFGGQLESRRGWLHMLVFVLLAAALSNAAQAYFSGNIWFGGFSGVNYALFGYIWMQSSFFPKSGFFIGQITIVLLVGWFFAGFLPLETFRHIANIAHGGGLFFGIVIGYLPVIFPGLQGKL